MHTSGSCACSAGHGNCCKGGVRCSDQVTAHLWEQQKWREAHGSANEEGLGAKDVYWLKVSLFPCSEASADHNFRALLHLVVLTVTWIVFGLTGLVPIQNGLWQT